MKALAILALALTGCAGHRTIYTAPAALECAMEGKLLGAIQIDEESNRVEARACATVRFDERRE